jgi:hypothetical protein
MYVRMFLRERRELDAEAGSGDRSWGVIFEGWFPAETDEKTIIELLKAGAAGVACDVCLGDDTVVFPEAKEVVIEFREEGEGDPVFRKIDGDAYEPGEEERKLIPETRCTKAVKCDRSDRNASSSCLMLVLLPGERPYAAYIKDELKALQQAVRGFIEFTYPFEDNCIVIGNDEAKLIGMRGNRRINGEIYAGPLLFAGDGQDGELCSLTRRQIEKYSRRFARPELYTDEEVENSIKIEVYVI